MRINFDWIVFIDQLFWRGIGFFFHYHCQWTGKFNFSSMPNFSHASFVNDELDFSFLSENLRYRGKSTQSSLIKESWILRVLSHHDGCLGYFAFIVIPHGLDPTQQPFALFLLLSPSRYLFRVWEVRVEFARQLPKIRWLLRHRDRRFSSRVFLHFWSSQSSSYSRINGESWAACKEKFYSFVEYQFPETWAFDARILRPWSGVVMMRSWLNVLRAWTSKIATSLILHISLDRYFFIVSQSNHVKSRAGNVSDFDPLYRRLDIYSLLLVKQNNVFFFYSLSFLFAYSPLISCWGLKFVGALEERWWCGDRKASHILPLRKVQ